MSDAQMLEAYTIIHDAIRANKPDVIRKQLSQMLGKDQEYILNARSNVCIGNLAFLACVLSDDETFLSLFESLSDPALCNVLRSLEDGNTPLTEAISWGRISRVETLLNKVSETAKQTLLAMMDHEGKTVAQRLHTAKQKQKQEPDNKDQDQEEVPQGPEVM